MKDNKTLDLISRHWSKGVSGLLVLAALVFFIDRKITSKKVSTKKEYIVASRLFEDFQMGRPMATEAIENMEAILAKHPELHAKYDGLMAHAWLLQDRIVDAFPYVTAPMARTQNILPIYYQEYAHTTLLISEGSYGEALQRTQQLDEQLAQCSDCQTLQTLNLLRLLALAKEEKADTLVDETWARLQEQPLLPQIESLFSEGDITLRDYLTLKS